MPKLINEIGNKYSRLTVVERTQTKKKGVYWHCKCDCGNEIDVLGASLRSGNTKSCGCLQKERASSSLIDLTDKIFGSLQVLKRDETKPKGHQQPVYWICKCECGNIVSVLGSHLKSGHTRSCGCYEPQNANYINEIGNKYGRLTVIEEAGRDKDRRILWRCKCECGNEKITLGKSLRAGLVQSCGCLHSRGEAKINSILTEYDIDFIAQYHTEELKSENNYFLYFDFFLPEYNIIIEYQGEQHFNPINRGFYTQENFDKLQKRDNLKRDWCIKKGIKLIEIPYTDYDKITIDYIRRLM